METECSSDKFLLSTKLHDVTFKKTDHIVTAVRVCYNYTSLYFQTPCLEVVKAFVLWFPFHFHIIRFVHIIPVGRSQSSFDPTQNIVCSRPITMASLCYCVQFLVTLKLRLRRQEHWLRCLTAPCNELVPEVHLAVPVFMAFCSDTHSAFCVEQLVRFPPKYFLEPLKLRQPNEYKNLRNLNWLQFMCQCMMAWIRLLDFDNFVIPAEIKLSISVENLL